ncbi:unnamed protein product [Paramecium sonneborni]|uniref:Uncharacterized protein n=1 Tax=Paramecium sonneborni TaxID=65129 RepID=A0A8S1MUJ5_9CILI|nr:unnamed protein product [Paramecium sonneborni]
MTETIKNLSDFKYQQLISDVNKKNFQLNIWFGGRAESLRSKTKLNYNCKEIIGLLEQNGRFRMLNLQWFMYQSSSDNIFKNFTVKMVQFLQKETHIFQIIRNINS